MSPDAVTRRMPTTRVERLPKRAPVPCVAVASAPASDCASMSPWFSSASPWRAFSRPRALSVMPACTVTRPDSASASITRCIPEVSTSTPSVHAMSVNE